MDKRFEISSGVDVLKLKTGINLYRTLTFVLFCFLSLAFVFFIIYQRDILEIIGSLVLSIIFLLITIFMDKLVYILKLPTNYLIVSKTEIIYQKGKKQFVYKVNEISYEFHSFFEDFESSSLLKIISNGEEQYITITKKQFELMSKFLNNKENNI